MIIVRFIFCVCCLIMIINMMRMSFVCYGKSFDIGIWLILNFISRICNCLISSFSTTRLFTLFSLIIIHLFDSSSSSIIKSYYQLISSAFIWFIYQLLSVYQVILVSSLIVFHMPALCVIFIFDNHKMNLLLIGYLLYSVCYLPKFCFIISR